MTGISFVYIYNNSNTTDAIFMKLYVHSRVKVIHVNFKFLYIMIISYLVMAHFNDFP